MLFGDFNGDGSDDVLQHGVRTSATLGPCWALRNGTMQFSSFERFKLSRAGSSPSASGRSPTCADAEPEAAHTRGHLFNAGGAEADSAHIRLALLTC